MRTNPPESAIILANGLYRTSFAKTAHGMVRGPSRYRIVGVIDETCAGEDAGVVLDGCSRDIPIFRSVEQMLEESVTRPDCCVIGVATSGGVIPPELRDSLVAAAGAGLSLVNGLHQLLADDPELVDLTRQHGSTIIDIRKPRPTVELRFWTGEVLSIDTPRIAVLGTDCAIGKRTSCSLILQALRDAGMKAEMVFTGQTGWLEGRRHGFILDATPNDFVCGELEAAILTCQRESEPEVILIEGQSSLRNPAGPCGSEFIVAGGARGVVLQHAPARTYFDELEGLGCRIPPIEQEIEIIRLLGAEVWAVALNDEGLAEPEAEAARSRLATELGIPVVLPLRDDLKFLAQTIRDRIRDGQS